MTQAKEGIVRTAARRRRTRRHRRNRLMRRCLLAMVVSFFTVGFSALVLRHLSPSLFQSTQGSAPGRRESETSRTRLLMANQEQLFRPKSGPRPVYPYSVVPGGVEDAGELKWVAEHDPVVAAHYAGFDYDHAREVRLVLARTVYVSYRIGNRVYWTRRRVKLHKGEKVITDGKITARARCANRVEGLPRQATSSSEPPVAKFEQPIGPNLGTAMQNPPVQFESALLGRPAPAFDPTAPMTSYSPFSGGSWTPVFPPPLPGGTVCAPGKKGDKEPDGDGDDKKKGGGPCGGPPESVPELGTWLLMATGLAGMCWHARRRFMRAPVVLVPK